jgi:hypothetical protein
MGYFGRGLKTIFNDTWYRKNISTRSSLGTHDNLPWQMPPTYIYKPHTLLCDMHFHLRHATKDILTQLCFYCII